MDRYGYGRELGFIGSEFVALGHNGLDPGVAAVRSTSTPDAGPARRERNRPL